jgi:hypothetical protein
MSLLLDLRKVAIGNRGRAWHETVRANYLDLDIRFAGNAAPTGTIVQTRIGAMTFSSIASAAQTHERTSECLDDEVDHLFAWLQLRGHLHLEQRGRATDIQPGCFVIWDANEHYRADFRDEHQGIAIRIPRLFFQGAFAAQRDIINVRIDHQEGSTVIVDYFRRMARGFDSLSDDQKVLMSEYGIRLMTEMMRAKV